MKKKKKSNEIYFLPVFFAVFLVPANRISRLNWIIQSNFYTSLFTFVVQPLTSYTEHYLSPCRTSRHFTRHFPDMHPIFVGLNAGSVWHGHADHLWAAFLCWINVGWSLIPSKDCRDIVPRFLLFSPCRVPRSCSFDRVTQQKSMRMNNSKFKKFRHLLPDLTWFECRAKCRDRLTFSSENTQNWPAFCSTNVGWMFGEMPGPLYRQALYGLRTEDSQPARCESWKLFLLTEEKRNNPQKTLVVRLRSTN